MSADEIDPCIRIWVWDVESQRWVAMTEAEWDTNSRLRRWRETVDDLQEPIANPERVDNGCMIFRSISGATETEGDK
jgi:hypothetical protein